MTRQALLSLWVMALVTLALPARADGHIVLWHSYRGGEERAIEQLAQTYETLHPGLSIEVLAVPFEAYGSKLEAAIPRAHGPDVFIQAHQWLGPYTDEHLVAPIGDALPDEDLSAFDPASLVAVTWEGVRYAVPLADKCLALFVNDALLPQTPPSIASLAALAPSLPPGVYPLVYRATNSYYHAPILHAFGGTLLDAQGRFAFHGTAAAASLVFARDLMQRGAVPLEPSGAL